MVRIYKGVEVPENDDQRIKAVSAYGILDTPAEQTYDDVTAMAAEITGCPVAYISIFDATRSWLKSSYGLPPNRPPRPREQSMCAPTICQRDMVVIEDLSHNPRYANLPAVQNPPHAKFYCGVPLLNRDAYALGTLCVWSPDDVKLSEAQREAMLRLARMTMDVLERRRDLLELESRKAEVETQLQRSRVATERAESLVYRLVPQTSAARLLANAEVPPRVMDDVTVICLRFPALDAERGATLLERLDGDLQAVGNELGLEPIGFSGDAYFALARQTVTQEVEDIDLEAAVSRMVIAANAVLTEADISRGSKPAVIAGTSQGALLWTLIGESRISPAHWGKPMVEAYAAALQQ